MYILVHLIIGLLGDFKYYYSFDNVFSKVENTDLRILQLAHFYV